MASVKKNFMYQAFYEVLIIILPLITSPYVSRVLGVSNVGTYSFTYATANYFVIFAFLGIKKYGNREISRKRDNQELLNKTFSSILILHFIVAGLAVLAYFCYALFSSAEIRVYTIISGAYVVAAFFDITWFFFGLEKFKLTVVRNSVIKLVSVICIFIFVRNNNDLWKYIAILAFANLFGQISLWGYVFKFVKICKVTANDIFKHLSPMFVLFIPTIATSLYNYMDKIMVGAISGNRQLGLYENSEKIISVLVSVIGSVGTVMLPKMSNLIATGNKEKEKYYIDASMQFVMCISIGMTFGLIGIANVFAPIFWGIEFSECALLLIFLAIVLPVKGYTNIVLTHFLIPNKQDKQYTLSVSVGAFVNFIINFLLIPKMESMGAVIGTIVAEVSVCIIEAYACRKELTIGRYILESFPYLIIGAVMFCCVKGVGLLLDAGILSMVLQIIFGAMVYGFLCIIYFKKTNNRVFLNTLDGMLYKLKNH